MWILKIFISDSFSFLNWSFSLFLPVFFSHYLSFFLLFFPSCSAAWVEVHKGSSQRRSGRPDSASVGALQLREDEHVARSVPCAHITVLWLILARWCSDRPKPRGFKSPQWSHTKVSENVTQRLPLTLSIKSWRTQLLQQLTAPQGRNKRDFNRVHFLFLFMNVHKSCAESI